MNNFKIKDGILVKYTGKETAVTIPDSVTSIGDSAFWDCTSLTSIAIPDSVTSIGSDAFNGCSSLTSISISDGVTSIGSDAFKNCTSLQGTTYDNAVYLGNKNNPFLFLWEVQSEEISSCIINERTKIVSVNAFAWCESLQSVHIGNGVTSIGESAFYGCESLQSISIPDSVTSIGDSAFDHCPKLKDIEISDNITSIPMIFGKTFPVSCADKIHKWCLRMSDAALKAYVLKQETWSALSTDTQAEIYNKKHSKALTKFFLPLMNETLVEHLVAKYLENAAFSLSATDCKKISSFMITYHVNISGESLQSLYEALLAQKNGKKAIEEITKDPTLSTKLSKTDSKKKKTTETEKKIFAFADAHKISVAKATQKLKDYYGLTPEDIAPVQDTEGKPVTPLAMLYLMTAHETMKDNDVVVQYKKIGISPEAAEILALLNPDSFQAALRKLANENLGIKGHSKKMYLAYPICRYANEELMTELTKLAPKWRSSVSGNDAPPLRTFREANLYSNTRAAILFADKYKELDRYAALRGTTADLLRDSTLSDIGLSANGTRTYDLGNQTVTAVLQKDLSFLIQLENGKTAKSLPKKGADPDAYATANADFSEMKKNAKKIVKNRQTILFEEFLSGKSHSADEWKAAYTENPLLRAVASLLVWKQGKNTFVLTENGTITSDEKSYEIGKTKISLAHPMEMTAEDLSAWQKYFVENSLKQPFEQIWEPVIDKDSIAEDRYKGCMIPYYRFTGKNKHGISVTDEDFHNEIYIGFEDLQVYVERIDWGWHYIDPNHRFEITNITFKKYTRMANHIIAYFDRITIYDRIAKDDVSILNMLGGFTLAQIMEFIRIASENNAVNVTALLLNYKNEKFPDFDPFAEFSLDFE